MLRSFILILATSCVSTSVLGQVGYTLPDAPYGESFDTLATTATATWTNNTTLPGWFLFNASATAPGGGVVRQVGRDTGVYAARTIIFGSDGIATTGAHYSYGPASGSSITDRALGSLPNDNAAAGGDNITAIVFRNDTALALRAFTLSYAGEQWRNGGSDIPQRLDFDWGVFSTFSPSILHGGNTTGYTGTNIFDGADFVAPTTGGVAGAIDGNVGGRVADLGLVQTMEWQPGQFLVLRWWNDNITDADSGIGIDDLTFVASIPAPPAAAALATLMVLSARRRRC